MTESRSELYVRSVAGARAEVRQSLAAAAIAAREAATMSVAPSGKEKCRVAIERSYAAGFGATGELREGEARADLATGGAVRRDGGWGAKADWADQRSI